MEAIQRSLDRYSKVLSRIEHGNDYIEYRYSEVKDEFGHTLPTMAYYNNDDDLYSFSWYKNGLTHRDDLDDNGKTLPAIIYSNGTRIWYKNGKYHRDDLDDNGRVLPAIIWSNGAQFWYTNGELHRDEIDENGKALPAIIRSDETQAWYKNGKTLPANGW